MKTPSSRSRKRGGEAAKAKGQRAFSRRQGASIVLAQLYRVAGVLRAQGEILQNGPWLKVLANILSSMPEGYAWSRKAPNAPPFFGLSVETLRFAATNCGLEVTDDEIKQQTFNTKAWRKARSASQGHPLFAPMRADKIGELLGITDMIRAEAGAWNIGTLGGSPESRANASRERDRAYQEARRRAAGSKAREEYLEANNLSRSKPWEVEGISRTTYYRRQPAAVANETSPSATSSGMRNETGPSETGPSATSSDIGTGPSLTTIHNELRSREFDSLPSDAGEISTFRFPKEELTSRANDNSQRANEIAKSRRTTPGGIAAQALAIVAREHERRRESILAVPASSKVLSTKVQLRAVPGPMPLPAVATPLHEECRSSVERLLHEMAAEYERRRDWWRAPVEGWNDGRLTIRSIVDGTTTVVHVATQRGRI